MMMMSWNACVPGTEEGQGAALLRPDQGPEDRYRLPGMENRTAAAIMMRNTTTTRNSVRKNMGAKLTAAWKTDGTARARTALVTGTVMVLGAGRITGTATGSGTVS